MYCDEHRITSAERHERSHKKRSGELRGSPHGQAQNLRQKLRQIRAKYGQNAITRWEASDGNCDACGAKYGDVSVHIHHIDEDKTNNALENYACLCFDCHKAVHCLLGSKDRRGLIGWFRRTYPDKPL